jgi:four helix bundle protein
MHQLKDLYRVANEFRARADRIAGELPAGRARLADQLRGAATAIVLHIADAVGTFALHDRAQLYRKARDSTTEAAAILDACRIVSPTDEPALAAARSLLVRTFAGLTDLICDALASIPSMSCSMFETAPARLVGARVRFSR